VTEALSIFSLNLAVFLLSLTRLQVQPLVVLLDRKVRQVLQVLQDQPVHSGQLDLQAVLLVRKVRKVTSDQLDPPEQQVRQVRKVFKALKVLLATPDLQVLLERQSQFLAHTLRITHSLRRTRQEILVTDILLTVTCTFGTTLVQSGTTSAALKVRLVRKVFKDRQVHKATLVQPDHKVIKVLKATQVLQARKATSVLKVTSVQLVRKVILVRQVQRVRQVRKVTSAQLGLKAQLVRKAMQVLQDLRVT
jgi:hypothetical protein